MTCCCGGKGLLKIQYQSGEPFDIAICACPRGQRLRVWHMRHPDWIQTVWQLEPDHRIAWLEDFTDEPVEDAKPSIPAYTKAAQLTPPKNRTR
jgi:hypothetical protein